MVMLFLKAERKVDNMEEKQSKRNFFKELALSRLGETRLSEISNSLMCVDEYNTHNDIWVRFIDTGTLVHTTYQNFANGKVKDPMCPSVFGIGYLGDEGEYQVKINNETTPQYMTWQSMLRRCYSFISLIKYPCYKGCSVDNRWLNYQVFGKWYDENYYDIEGETISLDKDILVEGNKVYSESTCLFVPKSINTMFARCKDKNRILNKLETYKGKMPDDVYNKVYIRLTTDEIVPTPIDTIS
ncbi:hypothetical protein [Metabacillus halosaccharovorans]|uniref:hypothetical protein n=1 Tax=Metabacillus halosaccharovorans TaxID=930124 RepID=UPI002040ADB2|nr:hypothetical protein [Metabacillus halosaccharovorans]MCM3444363.1 hypothetical protein [Metabacillus halosaccharovorans]